MLVDYPVRHARNIITDEKYCAIPVGGDSNLYQILEYPLEWISDILWINPTKKERR